MPAYVSSQETHLLTSYAIWAYISFPTSVKQLGITLDSKLTQTTPVDEVYKVVKSELPAEKAENNDYTTDNLLIAYHSLFHCLINHGFILWGLAPCTRTVGTAAT